MYTCTLTQTGFEVLCELITLVTAADGSECAVLTVVRTATVIRVTTVNNLHFNTYRKVNDSLEQFKNKNDYEHFKIA